MGCPNSGFTNTTTSRTRYLPLLRGAEEVQRAPVPKSSGAGPHHGDRAWALPQERLARRRGSHRDIQTFDIGRDELTLTDNATIGLYSAERSIIDAFRLRHLEGPELANEALKSWLRAGGQADQLLRLARSFPRAATPLRQTLEILL